PPPPPATLEGEDLDLPILFLDDDIIVVDKPAGIVVHPARGHATGTLVHGLLHLLREAGGDPARPGIVHRLDKGTSGTMVVTRTPEALDRLAADFSVHALDRHYLAVVWGAPPAAAGTVDAPIGRHPRDRKRFAVVEGGRRSVTHWALRGTASLPVPGSRTGGRLSLVECRLQTGRTHQVRVHLHHLGLPLVGDPVYRGRPRVPPALSLLLRDLDHPLLHAWYLGFRHPRTGAWMRFSSAPPADFQAILDRCGLELPDRPGQDLADRDMHLRPTASPGSEDPV
ncbi:MAG: RluA family pseudouridine synthase, partial [Deltaproteobacteria bacterium]